MLCTRGIQSCHHMSNLVWHFVNRCHTTSYDMSPFRMYSWILHISTLRTHIFILEQNGQGSATKMSAVGVRKRHTLTKRFESRLRQAQPLQTKRLVGFGASDLCVAPNKCFHECVHKVPQHIQRMGVLS